MEIVNLSMRSRAPSPLSLDVGGAPVGVSLGVGGALSTRDYNDLSNKPSIEGHVLVGDSLLPEIGVRDITPQDIDRIIFG